MTTAYFGPISWYGELVRGLIGLGAMARPEEGLARLIDTSERYQKQTTRNHCLIATANGVQKLTVPVSIDHWPSTTAEVRISNHGKWRSEHWNALCSAYGESPFFDYYADDLRPFFTQHDWEHLATFNTAITMKVLELIVPTTIPSQRVECLKTLDHCDSNVRAKQTLLPLGEFESKPYWQVYQQRHGFLPNLSILDLLFCMGPEAVEVLLGNRL